jgi:hypothetical protein
MDVYGKSPRTDTGEYFRNNVWWWHPLWTFCCEVAPRLTDKVAHGHSNDGDGLSDEDSVRLAEAITTWIDDGRAQQYVELRQKWLDELPLLECKYCEGTGTRHDGKEIGRPEPDFQCNACHGFGKVQDWQCNYSIDVDNITKFRDFLLDCGGFEIC